MLGAGGAARAIGVELALAGASSLTVVNRSEKRGRALVEHLTAETGVEAEFLPWTEPIEVPKQCDVLVNATSLGLYPNVSEYAPIDFSRLSSDLLVADVIPNPPKTAFIKRAAERGCKTIDGLGMLVNQGRIGIELWTGITPDVTVMRRALEELFSG